MRGILFGLPHIIPETRRSVETMGLSTRDEMHDWSDEQAYQFSQLPPGTSPEVVDRLNTENQCGPRRSQYQGAACRLRWRLRWHGLAGPADFATLVADETEKWAMIRASNIKAGVRFSPHCRPESEYQFLTFGAISGLMHRSKIISDRATVDPLRISLRLR
jgi:hypothetical protein